MLEMIGIAVACLVGVGGIIVGLMADSRAKKAEHAAEGANELAKTANSIAAEALAQAAASNQIAKDANELSEKANTVSERTLLHVEDESFVQWLPEWDSALAVLALVNQGRDRAHQPSIVVTGKEVHALGFGEDTAPGEKISISLPQVVEQRAKVPATRLGSVNGNNVRITGGFKLDISVVVLWRTEHGFQRQERIEFEIREGKNERRAQIW